MKCTPLYEGVQNYSLSKQRHLLIFGVGDAEYFAGVAYGFCAFEDGFGVVVVEAASGVERTRLRCVFV